LIAIPDLQEFDHSLLQNL